jgi:hypothetical protein
MEIKNKGKVIFYILALMLILLSVSFYFQKKVMEAYTVYHTSTSHPSSSSSTSSSSGSSSGSSSSWSSCTVC